MQLISFDVRQDPDFDHENSVAGAIVLCWVRDQTPQNARYIAEGWIAATGWIVDSLDEQSIVTAETYTNDAKHREYYEQALEDDEVFLFLTYEDHET